MDDIAHDKVVFKGTYQGRIVVVKAMSILFPEMPKYYCGYVEALDDDKLPTNCEDSLDLNAPGGITFDNELMEIPGKRMIGFDTLHPFEHDYYQDVGSVLVACIQLADQINGRNVGVPDDND